MTTIIRLFLASLCWLLHASLSAQEITDFFKLNFYEIEDGFDFYEDADSAIGTSYEDFGSNMYAFNQYLLLNYAQICQPESYRKLCSLSDSTEMTDMFNRSLRSDTLLQSLVFSVLNQSQIPDISLEKVLHLASHFYYLHREDEEIVMHICSGINGLGEVEEGPFDPYYRAFVYMVIRNREVSGKEWKSFDELLTYSAYSSISDEKLDDLREENYRILRSSEALKANILSEFDRKNEYLNFALTIE